VDVLDNSDYEGASVIHDLNEPVPERLHGRFDVVFDGGSLEHVFEFPTALRSVMAMVKPGGHLIVGTPTNNLSGHGFYQFSPELFHRALGPQSGFRLERMTIAEYDQITGTAFRSVPYFAELVGARYAVNPSALDEGMQISFTSRNPTMLFVLAKRVDDRPPLADPPQQGVWTAQWDAEDGHSDEKAGASPRPGAARRGPDPDAAPIPPAVKVRAFDLLFAGSGAALRPFRGLLMRVMGRRRALRHQSALVRRLRD
jgi:SAM-dependent methyltransferase